MKFTVLGSGGFLSTPLPGCACRICKQARDKGAPYSRRGPSLFLHDIKLLFDTPEDITLSLNEKKIKDVETIIFSHWHPDHTMGFRVVEALRQKEFVKEIKKPIDVYIPTYDYANVKRIVSALWYFEKQGYVKIHKMKKDGITIKGVSIKPMRLGKTTFSAFEVVKKSKRALICMDHSKHLKVLPEHRNIDLFYTNLGYFEHKLKNGKSASDVPRMKNLTSFQDNLAHIDQLESKITILSHIEERWNRNPDDLKKLEKNYQDKHIHFAIDGMDIKI